jgi:hypothetical protein
MFNSFNQSVRLATVLGLLMAATTAMANTEECGQAKLVESGSVGTNVSKSGCDDKSRLAVGSVVELAAGSRMWIKFDSSTKGETTQLICQNKLPETVNVSITNTAAPWIMAQGLKQCDKWAHNRLSCEGNSFFCAVAVSRPTLAGGGPTQTTSTKVRGFFNKPVAPEDVIKEITPNIELCKHLYNVSGKLDMSWTMSNMDMIKDLKINSDNPDLVNCVEGVVKQLNASQELSINYAF